MEEAVRKLQEKSAAKGPSTVAHSTFEAADRARSSAVMRRQQWKAAAEKKCGSVKEAVEHYTSEVDEAIAALQRQKQAVVDAHASHAEFWRGVT